MKKSISILTSIFSLFYTAFSATPQLIPIGKGSYASFPPEHEGNGPTEMNTTRKIYAQTVGKRPIPTNDWWTDLLVNQYSGELWAHPLMVSTEKKGVKVFYPSRWVENGRDIKREYPLHIQAANFEALDVHATDWSDWLLHFRMENRAKNGMDVTLGHGLPYVWIEFNNLSPIIHMDEKAALLTMQGQNLNRATHTTDKLIIQQGNRLFGVFAPSGTTFKNNGSNVEVSFSSREAFIIIGAIPDIKHAPLFAKHAYAKPVNTQLTWEYKPDKALVRTRWQLKTKPLRGNQTDTIQGWIPHHYRQTKHRLHFLPFNFVTPRGSMQCTTGKDFSIYFPFSGLLPHWPAPSSSLPLDSYKPERLKKMINNYASKEGCGGDTYWGGKDLVRYARYMLMAKEQDLPAYETLKSTLRTSLKNWFTYTPEDKEHYFAYYPKWKALVGFNESYGSAQFNDHHFHYGYFTLASALLGFEDPDFLEGYGEIATLVAKEYANWDRTDSRFPFLRTFDPWQGHSWAGGFSSPGGNNQESTSEAMQGWYGLFLLGEATGNMALRDTGAMGYAMESRATLEYWLDREQKNLPPEYPNEVIGILFGAGQAFATYFSGEPAWIYGIQWLPISPGLHYLVEEPALARRHFSEMMRLHKNMKGSNEISSMGAALGNVILGYAALFNPEWVASEFDTLWEANDPVARDNYTGGITYYLAHSFRHWGTPTYKRHIDIPTSGILYNKDKETATYTVFNPSETPTFANVYKQHNIMGRLFCPPKQLSIHQELIRPNAKETITWPFQNNPNIPFNTKKFYIATTGNTNVPSVTLSGKGIKEIKQTKEHPSGIMEYTIMGNLWPESAYQAELTKGDGSKEKISFKTTPAPPFSIAKTSPAQGEKRVPVNLKKITVKFNQPFHPPSAKGTRLLHNNRRIPFKASKPAPDTIRLHLKQPLLRDSTYTVHLPKTLQSIYSKSLGHNTNITFYSSPPPMPPNVYRESFCGEGYHADATLNIDFQNRESPFKGRYAMKLSTKDQIGSVFMFNGKSDHGDKRKGMDLSTFSKISFQVKGESKEFWIKTGHPVHDKGIFHQARYEVSGSSYRQIDFDLPEKRDDVGTAFVISLSPNSTVYIDEIRFIR